MNSPHQSKRVLVWSNVNLAPLESCYPQSSDFVWENELLRGFGSVFSEPNPWVASEGEPDLIWIHLDFNYPGILETLDDSAGYAEVVESVDRLLGMQRDLIRANRSVRFIVSSAYLKIYWDAGVTLQFQRETLQAHIHGRLASMSRDLPNCELIRFDLLVAEIGERAAFDPRLWVLARSPYSRPCLQLLANALQRLVDQQTPRKVLALDLDGTLWGGFLDEAEQSELILGFEGVGYAYHLFQQALLSLSRRGILLALITKNDHEAVLKALQTQPAMVLRESEWTSILAGWSPKSERLRALAETLGLSLDSFVFIDDDPRERREVNTHTPEVLTPELPEDPSEWVDWLFREVVSNYFSVSEATEEDGERFKRYRSRVVREAARSEATDPQAFLRSLSVEITLRPVTSDNLPRVRQLISRTNQFNLNKVMDKVDLGSIGKGGTLQGFVASYRDCFSEEGEIGLVIWDQSEEQIVVHALAVSCRVLEKRVEHALIFQVLKQHPQVTSLHFEYLPTQKNHKVQGFLNTLSVNESDCCTEVTSALIDTLSAMCASLSIRF